MEWPTAFVDSPWWLLWLFVRPEKRAMARWNRLEQAEVAAKRRV
jgi:hypothetical protein